MVASTTCGVLDISVAADGSLVSFETTLERTFQARQLFLSFSVSLSLCLCLVVSALMLFQEKR